MFVGRNGGRNPHRAVGVRPALGNVLMLAFVRWDEEDGGARLRRIRFGSVKSQRLHDVVLVHHCETDVHSVGKPVTAGIVHLVDFRLHARDHHQGQCTHDYDPILHSTSIFHRST